MSRFTATSSRVWALALLAGCGTNATNESSTSTLSSSPQGSSASVQATSSGVTSTALETTSSSAAPASSSSSSSVGEVSDASASSSGPDATSGADAADQGDAGAPAVRFVARVDYTGATGPRFAWSGSEFFARFTGSSIGVRMSGPTTYFDWYIDGVLQPMPFLLTTGTTSYPLATNLDGGPHELTVYRRNEPGIGATGDTTYLGLILDPAGGALLPPSAPSTRRIEIVGDSITTGFGDESQNGACPNQLAAQNYDVAYGAVAARTLNADLITIAWTGKGMYRNNDGSMTATMPLLYGLTLPDVATSTWNFSSWIPDAVVIYLGNNDFAKGNPGQPYVTTYEAFITRVRMNYPNALIVCTIGPNLTDPSLTEERTLVQGIVSDENTAGDNNVVFLEMPQPTAAEGTGCGGHPLAVTHARMGAALATLLQTKLGW